MISPSLTSCPFFLVGGTSGIGEHTAIELYGIRLALGCI